MFKLIAKVNAFDTKAPSKSRLLSKTEYNFRKQNLQKKKTEDVNKKILNTSGMVKKINYNTKITEKWNT